MTKNENKLEDILKRHPTEDSKNLIQCSAKQMLIWKINSILNKNGIYWTSYTDKENKQLEDLYNIAEKAYLQGVKEATT